jgi:hypothetical protein
VYNKPIVLGVSITDIRRRTCTFPEEKIGMLFIRILARAVAVADRFFPTLLANVATAVEVTESLSTKPLSRDAVAVEVNNSVL